MGFIISAILVALSVLPLFLFKKSPPKYAERLRLDSSENSELNEELINNSTTSSQMSFGGSITGKVQYNILIKFKLREFSPLTRSVAAWLQRRHGISSPGCGIKYNYRLWNFSGSSNGPIHISKNLYWDQKKCHNFFNWFLIEIVFWTFKELPRTIFRQISNSIFTLISLSMCCEFTIVVAFLTYMSKYLQDQFSIDASISAIICGGILLPARVQTFFIENLMKLIFREIL